MGVLIVGILILLIVVTSNVPVSPVAVVVMKIMQTAHVVMFAGIVAVTVAVVVRPLCVLLATLSCDILV